jgi:CubicO group peptidase (beta-lactamase class C family)
MSGLGGVWVGPGSGRSARSEAYIEQHHHPEMNDVTSRTGHALGLCGDPALKLPLAAVLLWFALSVAALATLQSNFRIGSLAAGESDEMDKARSFPVSIGATPRLSPNLSFGSITTRDFAGFPVNPVPEKGFVIDLLFNYTNPVCTRYNVKFEIDGRTWTSSEIDWGCGNYGTASGDLWQGVEVRKPGVHEVTITLDSDNRIAESDETDNTKTFTVTVRPAVFDISGWDPFFRSQIANDGAGGYAWLAMNLGEVIGSGSQGYGRAPWESVNPGTPLTITNQFAIASISKLVTWVGLLKVWEEGGRQFSLDDPFWPLLSNVFPIVHESVKRSTVRQLHEHKSGIGTDAWSKEGVRQVLREPLVAEPGTKRIYISPNPLLLSYIIEELSGEKYAHYIQSHLLLPMGITNMSENSTEVAQVLGYRDALSQEAGTLARTTPDYESPTGGWWASAMDMGRFLRGLHECTVLSEEVSRQEGLGGRAMEWAWTGHFLGKSGSYKSAIYHWSEGASAVLFINSEKADPLKQLQEAHRRSTLLKLNAVANGTTLNLSFFAPAGATYSLEYADQIQSATWTTLEVFTGDDTIVKIPAAETFRSSRFFRVRRN